MPRRPDYEKQLELEDFASVPHEIKALSLEDASDQVKKELALNIRQLREEISNDRKFTRCLALFLICLRQMTTEELKHSKNRKDDHSQMRVLSISELAGMTAARIVLGGMDRNAIDWTNHRRVLEVLRPDLVGSNPIISGKNCEPFSEDDVSLLIEGLAVYLQFKRNHLNSFSEISPK